MMTFEQFPLGRRIFRIATFSFSDEEKKMATTPKRGDNITKYEKPLPFNLDDFMDQHIIYESLEGWARPLVDEFGAAIQEKIRIHWNLSSKTRLLFSTMNPELIFEDENCKTMRLTKRNLATLDPKFQPELQQYVLSKMANMIEALRVQIRSCISASYTETFEVARMEELMAGQEESHYSFEVSFSLLKLS
jgi:hypothetical protein